MSYSRPKGVFRLAETVGEDWAARGDQAEVLRVSLDLSSYFDLIFDIDPANQQRIEGLLQSGLGTPGDDLNDETEGGGSSSRRVANLPSMSSPSPLPATSTSTSTSKPAESSQPQPPSQYQFRVIPPTSPRTRMMLPPKVLTIEESILPTAPADWRYTG